MSAGAATSLPIALVFGTALSLSFLGSVHCAAMCGGLVAISARTRVEFARYQLGRLVGYLALGALLGGVGETVLRLASWPVAMGFLVLLLLVAVGGVWRTRLSAASAMGSRLGQRLSALIRMNASPEWVGLGSAFLPCGWLWTACIAAAATGSALRGALYLAGFWLGSVPALGWAPVVLKWLPRSASRSVAAVTLVLGLASLGMHARGLRSPIAPAASLTSPSALSSTPSSLPASAPSAGSPAHHNPPTSAGHEQHACH